MREAVWWRGCGVRVLESGGTVLLYGVQLYAFKFKFKFKFNS